MRWIAIGLCLFLCGCLVIDPYWRPYSGPNPSWDSAVFNGSGIIVGDDGVILTARHVVRACSAIRVASATDAFRAVPATVRAADDKVGAVSLDLALIEIPTSSAPSWSPARFRDAWPDERVKLPVEGQGIEVPDLQDLRFLGYPDGALAPQPVDGAVTQVFAFRPQDMYGLRFWGVVGDARPGFSGGPLVDDQGAVLGLATNGGEGGGIRIGFALAARDLVAFLRRHDVQAATDGPPPPIRQSLVQIFCFR